MRKGECIFSKDIYTVSDYCSRTYSVYEYYDKGERCYVQIFECDYCEIMKNRQRHHMTSREAINLLNDYLGLSDCDCDDCDDCDCDCDCDCDDCDDCDDYDDDDDCDCDDYDDDDDCDCDDYDDDDDCDCDCDYD